MSAAQTAHQYYRHTRKGKVLRECVEHYVRDDLQCGLLHGQPLSAERFASVGAAAGGWLVIDTNVALHQIDLLEHRGCACAALDHIVVTQTALEEVRHNNASLHRRVCALLADRARRVVFFANAHHASTAVSRRLGETPNDFNDRAIRAASAWLARQVGDAASVTLLTNDRACAAAARAGGQRSATVRELVARVGASAPTLHDMVAAAAESDDDDGAGDDGRRAKRPRQREDLYAAHLPLSEVRRGIMSGRLFQGVLRCERSSCWRARVVISLAPRGADAKVSAPVGVLVDGSADINRAVDGDIVAITLLAVAEWEPPAGTAPQLERQAATDDDDDDADRADDAPAVAEPTAAPEHDPIATTVPVVPSDDAGAGDAASGAAGAKPPRAYAGWTPRARVVGIVRRNWRQYCCSLSDSAAQGVAGARAAGGSGSALVVPVDRRAPKVVITTRRRAALEGQRLLVALDAWPAWSRWPQGHYVATLGSSGDKSVETAVLLREHDIATGEWSSELLACLPPEGAAYKIGAHNSAGRVDLTALPVCSIDPPNCRDIDDALHVVPLGDGSGNFEVGVHIADVTHFVAAGSLLDAEAARRGTSTYLVERRLDMLPGLLTTELCSLRAGVDRFAFSVLITMTPDADVVDARFCRSIIHSKAALAYSQAQLLIDDPNSAAAAVPAPATPAVAAEVARSVRQLNALAKKLRARRMDAGALTLASPEVRFVLENESESPLDVQLYQLLESNALVEEFMLLANITVGKRILRTFPTLALLRRHPAPTRQQFDALLSAAAAVGVELDIEDSKRLADSLDAATREADPYFNKLLRIAATRCMAPAQYFCSGERPQEEWNHYGLAAPIYTHFTSPIRRYADVVVHRLLAAAIGIAPLPATVASKSAQHDIAEMINRRHRAAQLAGRASVTLHTLLYFKEHPTEEEAYILAIHAHKIDVMVPRFGIEGTIHLVARDAPAGTKAEVEHDPAQHRLTWTAGGAGQQHSVRVFDRVRVFIEVQARREPSAEGDAKEQQPGGRIQLALRSPPPPPDPRAGDGAPTAAPAADARATKKRRKAPSER